MTLTVAGLVNGNTAVTITDTAPISVTGSVLATAISLTGPSIAISGLVSDGGAGTVSVIANGGSITETGTLIAGTLSGSSTGATSLTGTIATANQVATLTNFTAASFILNNGHALGITGTLSGNPGAITIIETGVLNVSGLISGQGGVTIASNGAMAIGGTVTSPGGIVSISDTGALAVSGLINGSSAVTILETGPTSVGGNIVSLGSVGVTDTGNLAVSGTIRGPGAVALTANGGDMLLSGLVLSTAGEVTLTNTGTLAITSTSSIGAATTISIADTNAIALGGTLSAPRIIVNQGTNGTGTFTATSTALIQTGGIPYTAGTLPAATLQGDIAATGSNPGFYLFTNLFTQQSGYLTVSGLANQSQPPTIGITSTGTVAFGSSGLSAPTSWLILDLVGQGARSTGNIDVKHLDAIFSPRASGTALTGMVNGLSGNAAAGAANIAPGTNSSFQVNGCPIASINCVLLTTQGIPAASPLNNFVIGSIFNPTDEDDLLLPLVSDEVY